MPADRIEPLRISPICQQGDTQTADTTVSAAPAHLNTQYDAQYEALTTAQRVRIELKVGIELKTIEERQIHFAWCVDQFRRSA